MFIAKEFKISPIKDNGKDRDKRGASMHLVFEDPDPKEGRIIGLIQVCRAMQRSTTDQKAEWKFYFTAQKSEMRRIEPDELLTDKGYFVDATSSNCPFFDMSWMYKSGKRSLKDCKPDRKNSGWGTYNNKEAIHAFLKDYPCRSWEEGLEIKHVFEVAAVVITPPGQEQIIGVCTWGYRVDKAGNVKLEPFQQPKAVSDSWKAAANQWNSTGGAEIKIPECLCK